MTVECSRLLDGFDVTDERFAEFIVSEIAEKVYQDEITDDNISPTSNRTSLEEILRYHFLVNDENTLERLRLCVLNRAKKIAEEGFRENKFLQVPPLAVEGELHPDEEKLRIDLINEIAEQVYRGEISDDNPSSINGYTTLDQILRYHFELGENREDQLLVLKNRVQDSIKNRGH